MLSIEQASCYECQPVSQSVYLFWVDLESQILSCVLCILAKVFVQLIFIASDWSGMFLRLRQIYGMLELYLMIGRDTLRDYHHASVCECYSVEKSATEPFVMLPTWNVQWARWVNTSWILKSASQESVCCVSAVCYACEEVFFVPRSLLFILCVFVTVQWIMVHFHHHT